MTGRQDEALLAELGKEFARFRGKHAPRTRVPDPLRARVLAALDRGIQAARICRTCGVAHAQLRQWRKDLQTERSARPGRGDAQVLTVIEPEATREEINLDVGVGSWRLSICLSPEGGGE